MQQNPYSRRIDEGDCLEDQLGPTSFVWYSFCRHSHTFNYDVSINESPKAWHIACHKKGRGQLDNYYDDGTTYHFNGMCKEDEICVDGPKPSGQWFPPGINYPWPVDQPPYYARCVGHDYYVTLITKGTKPSTAFTVESDLHPELGQKYEFEATLTNDDASQVVVADSLEIQPHGADGSLIGKSETCNDCASIDVNTVPEGTTGFSIGVRSNDIITRARLYMTSLRVSDSSEKNSTPQALTVLQNAVSQA